MTPRPPPPAPQTSADRPPRPPSADEAPHPPSPAAHADLVAKFLLLFVYIASVNNQATADRAGSPISSQLAINACQCAAVPVHAVSAEGVVGAEHLVGHVALPSRPRVALGTRVG